jgi:hypothetical protein
MCELHNRDQACIEYESRPHMRFPHLIPLLLLATASMAQTTAQDFTLNDCSGTSHHLFDELDAGKIIILEFAMVACSPCIDAGLVLQQVLDAHEMSHPGTVKWYALGYVDTYTCATMEAWDTDNGFTPSATFNSGADQVLYYGGMAMPTIVVLAGSDHQVVLVQYGYIPSTQSHVEGAVATALTIGVEEHQGNDFHVRYDQGTASLSLIPTWNAGHIKGTLRLTLMDVLGRTILTQPVRMGENIPMSSLAQGTYTVLIGDANGSRLEVFRFVRE